MSQDLNGCRKSPKFKGLIPRLVVFVNDPTSEERRIDFYCFMVLWKEICLNMCHGNSENRRVNQVGDYVSYCSLPCTLYESLNK